MYQENSKCKIHYNYFNGDEKIDRPNRSLLNNLTDGKSIGSNYKLKLMKRPTQSNMVTCKLT